MVGNGRVMSPLEIGKVALSSSDHRYIIPHDIPDAPRNELFSLPLFSRPEYHEKTQRSGEIHGEQADKPNDAVDEYREKQKFRMM